MDPNDSVFSEAELAYLHGQRHLARIATVGRDGTPHVVPVGWSHNAELDTIDVGGHELERTKKFRDVARTGRAAIVIDDLASTDPWRPRAIEVRGRAEAIEGPRALIRIHPERIVSWGLGPARSARDVAPASAPVRARARTGSSALALESWRPA
jgi:pyridoxamine 5'-phosphate oxidase family protein